MPTPRFIHLHLHTEYSLVDGLIGVKPLMRALAGMNMPAVALTDHCNLFAMVKFYKAAIASGIKPIIGADVWIGNSPEDPKPYRLILLCKNESGYKNLTRLISRSYLEGQQTGLPLIQKSWLQNSQDGLIALSGKQGDIGQAILSNHRILADSLASEWAELFQNNFYIELQRTGREHEEAYIQIALEIASLKQIPVVASNDVHFLSPDDFEAHEARVCIHGGFVLDDHRRPKTYSEQQYLRSEEEMIALFADIPQALENTVEIAKRCNLELSLGKSFLPNFAVPAGMTIENFFREACSEGLQKRLQPSSRHPVDDLTTGSRKFGQHPEPKSSMDIEVSTSYQTRLDMEMNVIQQMGFIGYFLIVADFIRWAKEHGIAVGPGRGSGAGSLVAYVLGITDLDPIQHDLLFERFLNPERVSMADFDIDFCMEGRDRVIDYVAQKYGRASVAQIITYGTMAARAVVRDVGRVLGYPYGFVDKIAKLIPFELGMTLKKALKDEPLLRERYEQEEELKTLIDLGMKLEGVPRNVGKHAGGVVIAPSVLTDFTPLYCEPGFDNRVTQFDKNDVEDVGLVKFDFLGLRTLTIMDWALQTINASRHQKGEPPIDLIKLPLDDKATFDLLKACDTTAVFQLESRGIKELIHRLQPGHFDEIVALVALYRPGPLQSGMVDDFINRKHGRAQVEYPHPLLEPILSATYGVILYQEQVMQIAQVLAGYTLGGADILRRAMGKKKPEEMAKQRAIFVSGAEQRQIDSQLANQIFDLMEMFADYGFNKSHSAAYALLSYQTAWLKAHYPAEFMAAVLSSDMDHTDKVVRFLEDAKKMGLHILPPDINTGHYQFTVVKSATSDQYDIRLLSKLADVREVREGLERRTAAYIDVREDSSTEPTNKFPTTVEFRKKSILYGLGAIKGVGQAAIESIIQDRQQKGIFTDLFSFCQRAGTRKVNRKMLEALIRSGAMDSFKVERATLMASIDTALKSAEQSTRAKTAKQSDLFGTDVMGDPSMMDIPYVHTEPFTEEQRLTGEKAMLGWYVSGHPIARYAAELAHFTTPICDLKPARDKTVTVAGYVTAMRVIQTKAGGRIAFLTLDDRTASIDLAVFTEAYESYRGLLVKDQLLIVEGEVSVDDYTELNKLQGKQIYQLSQAREKYAHYLQLDLHHQQLNADFLSTLKKIISPFCGGACPVIIDYTHAAATAHLQLGNEWRLTPSEELLTALRELVEVKVQYKPYVPQ